MAQSVNRRRPIFIDIDMNELAQCSANLKRPQIVNVMESNGHNLKPAQHLLYFKEPPLQLYPLDLNKGYEEYIFRYDYAKRQLGPLEKFILQEGFNSFHCNAPNNAEELTKIITRRGSLNVIMMWPYEKQRGKTILATKYNGNIYMSLREETSYAALPPAPTNTHHFKFEQYCQSDSTKTTPNTDEPIDENKQLFGIFTSELGNYQFMYSVELDAIIADEDITDLTDMEKLNQCHFITTKLIKPNYSWYENRDLKWWVQAQWANVSEIYRAIKDKHGFVNEPGKRLLVKDLPKGENWKPDVCISFLHKFMKTLDEKMADVNCPYTVYQFGFNRDKKTLSYTVHKGKNDLTFLSDEFIKCLKKSH